MPVDYSRRARDYDEVRADDRTDREFWVLGLMELGRIAPGDRVLDLGAGTGRFASLLHPTNRVIALDPSVEMLTVARGKAPFACVRGDGQRLPFRRDSFDVTIAVMVLQHLAHFEAAIREAARIAPRIVIATSDLSTRRVGILEEAFPSLLSVDRNRFPQVEAIVASLKAAGFGRVRVERRPLVRTLSVERQLDRVRRKYLSTFDLLPPGEYERGLGFLEREMPRRFGDAFELVSEITFVAGTR